MRQFHEVPPKVPTVESSAAVLRSGATKAKLQSTLGPNFDVLKFACRCEEDWLGWQKSECLEMGYTQNGIT